MGDKSKYPTIYWAEYSAAIISKYGLKQTTKGEYHGGCPSCGGKDRFWISQYKGEVRVHCRQCNDFAGIYDEMRMDGVLPTEHELEYHKPIAVNDLSDFQAIIPYHERKGVGLNGAVLDGDTLIVPIIDVTGKRVNQQTITPDGKKKFSQGAVVSEAFGVINGPLDGLCYIAEGWATAASVSESTGRPCVFALNSGNLPKVAKVLTEARPQANFIVAADNDEAGIKAAKESGLLYRAPRRKGADWNDVMLEDGPLAVQAELKKVKAKQPLFVPLGDLEFKAPEWIIDGLLEKNTFAVCFGAPSAGKTFLTIDMSLCIASGKDFHGHKVDGGVVFYIAGEGHNGFARRAAAWSKANEVPLKGLPFFKSSRSIVLTDEQHVDELRDVVDEMVQQFGSPALIVIDTLARAMGAADENSTKEMGAMIRVIDEIKDDYGCTVLAVHHTGHANKDRARGSSSLLGAVDCEFMVDKWGDQELAKVEVKYTKMKDANIPPPMNFAHREIDLIGSDLQEAKSVVLEPIMDSRSGMSKEDRAASVVKAEFEKLVEISGENSVSRSVLKANVSLELGVSQRTADRHIKTLIDVQELIMDNNKLQAAWTSWT